MPSVASEANAIIHHRSKASRNPSAANGRNPEGPFASLLDTDVETPAASKPQKPGPRQPARRSQAATDARPAASSKQARKPAAEKTPDTPDTGDAEKPAETASETGETPDIAADLAAAAPVAEADAPVEEFPALEAEETVQQPVIAAQPAPAATLPVAAEIAVTAPEIEVDLLAQASAPPVMPDNPQDAPAPAPAPEEQQAQPAPLQAADTEVPENTKKAETTPDASASATDDDAAAENVPQAKPDGDEPAHKAETENLKPDTKTENKPRAHNDVRPEPAPQAQDPAPATKVAADTTQTLTLTPAQLHASATGQAHSASATPDAQAVPVSGLAVEIAAQARAGKHRFEIRLDPPELGRIDVRLDVDREGNVTSRLVIERADTYDLLRRDASTLERALQNAGLKTSDNALEFSLRDHGFARRDEQNETSRNAAHVIVNDEIAGDAVNPYGRLIGLGTGVDIRV